MVLVRLIDRAAKGVSDENVRLRELPNNESFGSLGLGLRTIGMQSVADLRKPLDMDGQCL